LTTLWADTGCVALEIVTAIDAPSAFPATVPTKGPTDKSKHGVNGEQEAEEKWKPARAEDVDDLQRQSIRLRVARGPDIPKGYEDADADERVLCM
jgi:hypothetical protein